MGCIIAVLALAVPRGLMLLAFLLTDWFARAFQTQVWPIVGFVFMPYTTLAYLAAMLNNNHALSGGWLALLIVGVVLDVGHWGGAHKYRRK